jgi:hypothetical protein
MDQNAGKHRQRHVIVRALLSIIFLAVCFISSAAESLPERGNPTTSLIAVGDVHGDFDDFILILQHVGLIDAQRHWAGGTSTIVQVGDLLDRGPRERDVLDFLMSLEPEARKTGGHVVVLLGNHEVMNILGDLRYVTADEYASFADGNSEHRRRSAFKQYLAWHKSHAAILSQVPAGTFAQPIQAAWMLLHPLGYVEQRQAFDAIGTYGVWLRNRAAVAQVDDTVFLHGGIHPRFSSMSLENINAQVRDEIRSFDDAKKALIASGIILPFFTLDEITAAVKAQLSIMRNSDSNDDSQMKALEVIASMPGWLCVSPDGPLWFRGYAQWSEHEGGTAVQTVLQKYGAAHLVVGHTPQTTGRIRSRFDGKVFMIDTGMLDSYYPFGRASALKIKDRTKFIAEYTDSSQVLVSDEVVVPEVQRASSPDGAIPAMPARFGNPNAALERLGR